MLPTAIQNSMDEPLAIRRRSTRPLLGAAHLAWGIAIFLALVAAAQQLPVPSTAWLEGWGYLLYIGGLAWLGLTGWRNVDLGWQLRHAASGLSRPWLGDVIADVAVTIAMIVPIVRGEASRLWGAGLDRWSSALLTVGCLSVALWALDVAFFPRDRSGELSPGQWRLRVSRGVLGAALAAGVAVLEIL